MCESAVSRMVLQPTEFAREARVEGKSAGTGATSIAAHTESLDRWAKVLQSSPRLSVWVLEVQRSGGAR